MRVWDWETIKVWVWHLKLTNALRKQHKAKKKDKV